MLFLSILSPERRSTVGKNDTDGELEMVQLGTISQTQDRKVET